LLHELHYTVSDPSEHIDALRQWRVLLMSLVCFCTIFMKLTEEVVLAVVL